MAKKTEKVKGELVARIEERSLPERLAERTGATAHASAVFGEPVKRGDVKVIPVARARWGFGGGSGTSPEGSGTGGGGAGWVTPIGYIEVRDDGAEFKPIPDRRWMAVAAAAVGVAAMGVARAFTRR
jgi:uncharacterized spore protein YtfJ